MTKWANFKLAQLKTLATRCGLPTTGTKPEISRHLDTVFHQSASATAGQQRILSIDLGLRNLSYSLILPKDKVAGAPATHRVRDERSTSADLLPPPTALEVWRKVALVSSEKPAGQDADPFTPAAMAELSCNLLHDKLIPLRPTHILIERQRWRTGGHAAVQEWTLRVNVLEAMIYAQLRTMNKLGSWKGEVIPIQPGRVGAFWVPDEGHPDDNPYDPSKPVRKVRQKAAARDLLKRRKINLVGRWLEADNGIDLGNDEVELAAAAFLDRWKGIRKSRNLSSVGNASNSSVDEPFNKLDDLADSILQGLAWIQWEENRDILRNSGGEELLL